MMNNPLDSTLSSEALTSNPAFHNVFALAFVVGMLVYWGGVFIIMYHLIRFGVGNQPKKIAIVFLGGALILSIITSLLFAQIILS
jgi:hypothetical protein